VISSWAVQAKQPKFSSRLIGLFLALTW